MIREHAGNTGKASILFGRAVDRSMRLRSSRQRQLPDRIRELRRARREQVSEEFRDLLEAYYRTISRTARDRARLPSRP